MGEAEAVQETIPLQAPASEEADPPDFSVLRLHSSPPHRRRHSPCSSCGCCGHSHSNSRKRRLPLPLPHHPAKKLFLDTPPPESAGAFFPLRRTLSDSPGSASNSSLPPLPPSTLRRCTSDPIPIPPHSKSVSSSSAQKTGESYISKRNKMLSSWREFNQWMEKEFTAAEEEEQNPKPIDPIPTEEEEEEEDEEERAVLRSGGGSQEEFEESLSVEKDGERLNIHFKCHCGNGYQFLLADGNCYYKLI